MFGHEMGRAFVDPAIMKKREVATQTKDGSNHMPIFICIESLKRGVPAPEPLSGSATEEHKYQMQRITHAVPGQRL